MNNPFYFSLHGDKRCSRRFIFREENEEIHITAQMVENKEWKDYQQINNNIITVELYNTSKKVKLMCDARDSGFTVNLTESPYVANFATLPFSEQKNLILDLVPYGPRDIEIVVGENNKIVELILYDPS